MNTDVEGLTEIHHSTGRCQGASLLAREPCLPSLTLKHQAAIPFRESDTIRNRDEVPVEVCSTSRNAN